MLEKDKETEAPQDPETGGEPAPADAPEAAGKTAMPDGAAEPDADTTEDSQAGAEGEPGAELAEESELSREAELEARVAELKDQLLRAMAEQENLRKRSEREREQIRKFGISNFAKDLLSAADNLGRALAACPTEDDSIDEATQNFILGVQMTERELQDAFARHGIRKIDPVGEKFDYNFHQAMFETEDSGQEPGTVVQVLQPGYAIEDRVLRAAMVGVAKAAAESPAAELEDGDSAA